MNTIEKNICTAIDIIVNKAISEAEYDKTIQATVESCVDATIGKYKVKYQDSTFYAYSGSSDITYVNGSSVYVLIPGNNMSRDKTILGTTKRLGINYVSTTEKRDEYDINGINCLSSSETFELSSYYQEENNTFVKVLYHKDYPDNQNLIKVDAVGLDNYVKTSSSIMCGCMVRTALPPEQQNGYGNYGIIFALDFLDNATKEIVTRIYTIDINSMVGNPYALLVDTEQKKAFDNIDGSNLQGISYIAIFAQSFPHTKPKPECVSDIFFSNIELCGATRLSETALNGYSLSLNAPQTGSIFTSAFGADDVIFIEASVKVKGKAIDNNSQKLDYYWFVENGEITSDSKFFNIKGGAGWQCLNSYNILEEVENGNDIIQWLPETFRFAIKKSDVVAKEIKYKCVVDYGDENGVARLESTIIIKNLDAEYDIAIESDQGEQFYYDNGHPTLTCIVKVKGEEVIDDSFSYAWSVTNNVGQFNTITETNDLNAQYHATKTNYDNLLAKIEREEETYVLNEDKLKEYEEELKRFDEKIERVEKNKIYNLNLSTITVFSDYKCSVYRKSTTGISTYIGTASINIKNTYETEGSYSLVINDGSYSYKYSEDGVSPASPALESPIVIKPLTFTVYNNLGMKIDDDVIKYADIRWIVPSDDTMIVAPEGYVEVDLINKNYIYNGTILQYYIENSYNPDKNRNTIELQVNYEGVQLTAKTDLTFIKEGESGTNGTEYVCRIVPNVAAGSPAPAFPTYTWIEQEHSGSVNYKCADPSYKFFRAQLWHNGEIIFDSTESGRVNENGVAGESATVVWSMLKNNYGAGFEDASSFDVDAAKGIFNYKQYITEPQSALANIVKVAITYQGVVYYATLPFITVNVSNSKYRAVLKEGTGFRFVMYDSGGRFPIYDSNNPFEITVTEFVEDQYGKSGWEDISEKTSDNYKVSYQWNILGKLYFESKWLPIYALQAEQKKDLKDNQKSFKPIDSYDGHCVTTAIEVIVSKKDRDNNDVELVRVHIPIHLFLNRYSQAMLNGWDGNSVSISEDGGFILAPQVGAGIKETDNSFTGVLMGKVRERVKEDYNPSSVAEVGLFEYAKGERTIFLDARTGRATFGQTGKGQIVLDPTQGKALIYGGDYQEKGPEGTPSGKGMLIDLTTPEIKFGTQNFMVDKYGYITAVGGGTIAGWSIDDTSLYSNIPKAPNNVILSSADFERSINGSDAKEETNNLRIAVGQKFAVSKDGTMYAGDAVIGTGTNKIRIGQSTANKAYSALYSNDKDAFNQYTDAYGDVCGNGPGFYIGVDGISLGSSNGTNSPFQVNANGELIAKTGYIGNGMDGWLIGPTSLSNHKASFSSVGTGPSGSGVYIGSDGISLGGNGFSVNNLGSLYAISGEIGGWTINNGYLNTKKQVFSGQNIATDGIYIGEAGIRLGEFFYVDKYGNLTAEKGTFNGTVNLGGWTVGDNVLKSKTGDIVLNSETPSIILKGGTSVIKSSNDNWSIKGDGTATFENVKITGKNSSISNGATIGGGTNFGSVGSIAPGGGSMSIGGTSFSPNLTNLPKGTQISGEDLEGYFKKIVAQTVTANNYELSVNGNVYKFGMRYVMTGISEVINSGGKITIKYTIRPALTNLSIDEGHSEKSSG